MTDEQPSAPFGPSLQRYWDRLSVAERGMRLDAEALYSLVVQPVALETAARTPGTHVLDAFCGAGGSAIGFARAGKRVTAIEIDPARLAMARENASLFGVADRIDFLEGDALALIPSIPADSIFLAPPWGGPAYTRHERFTLACFTPDGNEILTVAMRTRSTIVMQLPRTFDLGELDRFGRALTIFEDRLGDELLSLTAVMR